MFNFLNYKLDVGIRRFFWIGVREEDNLIRIFFYLGGKDVCLGDFGGFMVILDIEKG